MKIQLFNKKKKIQEFPIERLGLDFFENNEGDFNAAIIAGSASGIHLLSSQMITNILSDGGSVILFDCDGSHTHLCQLLGGKYINVRDLRINPLGDNGVKPNGYWDEWYKIILDNCMLFEYVWELIIDSLDNETRSIAKQIIDKFKSKMIFTDFEDDYFSYVENTWNNLRKLLSDHISLIFDSKTMIDSINISNPPKLIVIDFQDLLHNMTLLNIVYNAALLTFSNLLNLKRLSGKVVKTMILLDTPPFSYCDVNVRPDFIQRIFDQVKPCTTSIVSINSKLEYYLCNSTSKSLYVNSSNKIFIMPDDIYQYDYTCIDSNLSSEMIEAVATWQKNGIVKERTSNDQLQCLLITQLILE